MREPTLRLVPRSSRYGQEWGDLACDLAAGYDLTADDWQRSWCIDTLRRRKGGRFAAATSCLCVPRQNGKNGALEIRELFGMVVLGERILHTAHEVKTARKAFRRIASFFENERRYPELAALVVEIRKTNGQECIVLSNGGSIEFIARSSGSGRGFTVDVLVCDEVQDLTDDELAALLPTISAAPLGNPQVVLTGTPPDPDKQHLNKGEVIRRTRASALLGDDPRLCFHDFGVPDGPLPDVNDKALWHRVNPALGDRLHILEVERELALMSPAKFARERLGWWGDPSADINAVFPVGSWEACASDAPAPKPTALAVAVSVDQAWSSIGAATAGYVGAVQRFRGTSDVVDEVSRIALEHDLPVVVDGKGPGAYLIRHLKEARVDVVVAGMDDVTAACAGMFDAVAERVLAHGSHDDLNAAVAAATKRNVGERWAWARRSGDVSMLEAVTLAHWHANQILDYDPLDSIF